MIFLTVGTSFPFDRLVQEVDETVARGRIDSEIFAQVGRGGYTPKHFDSSETLEKKEFDRWFQRSEAVISHAGMGTITMALEQNKPILVVPRLKELGELVNDHQLATAKRFEQMGHVLAVYEINELPGKVKLLKSFQPVPRESQVEQVAARIGIFLHHCLEK